MHEHAFDRKYGWDTAELFKQIASGKADAAALKKWVAAPPETCPAGAYGMRLTSNHDINAWQGSDSELYGPSLQAMAMLAVALPGMPLIYGGQETGMDKGLAFFKQDPIACKQYGNAAFYTRLLTLKKTNPALSGWPVRWRQRRA